MIDPHTLWAASQLAPGEGIEDGVARISAILRLTAPMPEPAAWPPEVSDAVLDTPEPDRWVDIGEARPLPMFHMHTLMRYGEKCAESGITHGVKTAPPAAPADEDAFVADVLESIDQMKRGEGVQVYPPPIDGFGGNLDEAFAPEPYLCIKPACGNDCSGCNKAISAQTMRDYAIAHAATLAAAPAPVVPLTTRELELIDGMIEVQLHHAKQCDGIANRTMADKQKGWDMERVELLRKMRGIWGGGK